MLHLPGSLNPFADSFSRREAMRVGGLGTLSLALPELFPLQSLQADSSPSSATFGRAKRILLIYLQGAAASSNLSDKTSGHIIVPVGIFQIAGESLSRTID